ncbi:MAG: 50S ribosomal protein L25, partial [Rhodoferax sp.]|nr:50S ribosomal protein L25 [Rhodoferax sp.]
HLAQIEMPKGVSVVIHGGDKNPVVVSVVAVAGAEPVAAPADEVDAAKPAAAKPAAKPAAKK